MMVAPRLCGFPGADTRQWRNGRSDGRFLVSNGVHANGHALLLADLAFLFSGLGISASVQR